MADTGKKFLRIDASVDERRDPFASPRAAARLLKQNYRLFDNNWPLAITAYNHGTEKVFRAIKTVRSTNLVEIIKQYQSPTFGFASKNFHAEFLAVVDITTKRDAYFPFLRGHRPLLLREIDIKRQVPLQTVLKPAAISHNEFFDWNPALDRDITAGYRVKLPAHKLDAFVAAHRRTVVSLNKPPSQAAKFLANSTARSPRVKSAPATAARESQRPAKAAVRGNRTPVKDAT